MRAAHSMRGAAARLGAGLATPFVVSGASRVGVQMLAFAVVVVASRHLDLAQFGMFALASAVAVILCSLLYTGFYEGLLRASDVEREAPTVLLLMMGAGLGFGIVMLAAAAALGATGRGEGVAALLAPMALVPVLAAPTAWCEALGVRRGAVRAAAVLTLVAEGIGFVALVVAFRLDAGAAALVWCRLSATAAALLLKIPLAKTSLAYLPLARGVPAWSFQRVVAREAWTRARPLYGASFSRLMGGYGTDIVLGLVLSPAAVGAFRAGSRVAGTGAEVIVRPMHAIAWSRYARLEREGALGTLRAAWLRDTAFLLAVAWPAMAGLALLSGPITRVVLGSEWLSAAPVIAVLALARAFAAADMLVDPVLVCTARAGTQMRLRAWSALVALALAALAAPFGPAAAAGGVFVAAVGTAGVALALARHATGASGRDLREALVPGGALTALVVGSAAIAWGALGGTAAPLLAVAGCILAAGAIWAPLFGALLLRGRLVLPRT